MTAAFVLGTSTGGTARHVRMLAGGCVARGVAAEVFGPAQTDRDFAFRVQAGFTPVEIADRPRVLRDLRAVARLRRLIRAWRPDVVHAHGLRAGALTAIAVAFVRSSVYHPRPALVVTVHNAPAAGGVRVPGPGRTNARQGSPPGRPGPGSGARHGKRFRGNARGSRR
jgi:hypothetical protein